MPDEVLHIANGLRIFGKFAGEGPRHLARHWRSKQCHGVFAQARLPEFECAEASRQIGRHHSRIGMTVEKHQGLKVDQAVLSVDCSAGIAIQDTLHPCGLER